MSRLISEGSRRFPETPFNIRRETRIKSVLSTLRYRRPCSSFAVTMRPVKSISSHPKREKGKNRDETGGTMEKEKERWNGGPVKESPAFLIRSKPHYDLRARPREPSISINTDREYHYTALVVAHFEYERSKDIMLIEPAILQYTIATLGPEGPSRPDFSPTRLIFAGRHAYMYSGRRDAL